MLGQAGQESIAAELAPEISPTFELEGQSVEWNFLKGVRDIYVGQTIAASALNVGKWRFRNPTGSGVIACFTYVALLPTTAATGALAIRINTLTADLPTAQPTTVPDTRWGPLTTGRSAIVATFTNTSPTIPAGQTIAQSRFASIEWRYEQEIVLLPGSGLDVGGDTINTAMTGSFVWHERPFPVLER